MCHQVRCLANRADEKFKEFSVIRGQKLCTRVTGPEEVVEFRCQIHDLTAIVHCIGCSDDIIQQRIVESFLHLLDVVGLVGQHSIPETKEIRFRSECPFKRIFRKGEPGLPSRSSTEVDLDRMLEFLYPHGSSRCEAIRIFRWCARRRCLCSVSSIIKAILMIDVQLIVDAADIFSIAGIIADLPHSVGEYTGIESIEDSELCTIWSDGDQGTCQN